MNQTSRPHKDIIDKDNVDAGAGAVIMDNNNNEADAAVMHNADADTSARATITEKNARDSPLLRLSAELRNKIYKYALSGYVIKVEPPIDIHAGHRIRFQKRVPGTNSSTTENEKHSQALTTNCRQEHCEHRIRIQKRVPGRNPSRTENEKHFQALTTICRKVHSETALLPLMLNEINVVRSDGIVDLANRLTFDQRNAVRYITICVWDLAQIYLLATWTIYNRQSHIPYLTYQEALKKVLNGAVLTQRMREEFPGLKVVVLAGHDHSCDLRRICGATAMVLDGVTVCFDFIEPVRTL